MTVAEVVAQPGQRQAGFDAGGDDGFVGGADADDFAALGLQEFALSQHGAAVEEQANVVAGVGFGAQAAAHAQFEGQRQVVVDFAGFHGADSLCQFKHVVLLSLELS